MHFIRTITKRELWFVFISLIVGVAFGAELLSFMVPDATHWISLYHVQKNEMTGEMAMGGHDMSTHVTSEKQFVEAMIPHHEAAVVMAQDVLKLHPRSEIKNLAEAGLQIGNSFYIE
jgi:hypothetical protein